MPLPDDLRDELERRLGAPYRLDGSFASLWALERVFESFRKVPCLSEQAPWIPSYLRDLLGRAWSEMGLSPRSEGTWLITERPAYRVNLDADVQRLAQPPAAMPTLFGTSFAPMPGLGAMCLPWYGLANVLQNHTWAEASHDLIGRLRDHLDRGVPWLAHEQAKVAPPELADEARAVTRAMVWPPLAYTMNDHGELNRKQLEPTLARLPDAARTSLLRALARSQDESVALLAAWGMARFGVTPQHPPEARALRRARDFFGLELPAALHLAVEQIAPAYVEPKDGVDDPRYGRALALATRDPAGAKRLLDELVAAQPMNAVYHCTRGFVRSGLRDEIGARNDYDRALELSPRYVQALLNRAISYGQARNLEAADADLMRARAVDPDNADVRNNLLVNHFLRLRGDTPLRRIGPPPKPAPAKPSPSGAPADNEAVLAKCRQALAANKKILAVKLYREAFRCSLAEAKAAVERL